MSTSLNSEDALVGLRRLEPRDVHEVRLPGLARPLLHELQLVGLEASDPREEQLAEHVLQITFSCVMNLKEGSPSDSVQTALCSLRRPA